MKKILIITTAIIVFTGCTGDDSEAATENLPGKTQYQSANFSIEVPADWDTIESGEFTSAFPLQTQVAFRNNIKNEIFTANVNVTLKQIAEGTSSADYGKSMLASAQKSLHGYQELGNIETTITYGEEELQAVMYEFQGKKSTVEPIVKFRQLHLAFGGLGYTVTAAYLPSESETTINTANQMLDSFGVK